MHVRNVHFYNELTIMCTDLISSVIHFHIITVHIQLHVLVAKHCGRFGGPVVTSHVISQHEDYMAGRRKKKGLEAIQNVKIRNYVKDSCCTLADQCNHIALSCDKTIFILHCIKHYIHFADTLVQKSSYFFFPIYTGGTTFTFLPLDEAVIEPWTIKRGEAYIHNANIMITLKKCNSITM